MKRLSLLLILLMPTLASGQVLLAIVGWPANPDLPQNVPTGALPANWNAAADHTPADGTALQELLDGDGSGDVQAGDVISLDADVDYGPIVVDDAIQGAADNWIIIRSDEYASLPAYGSRVTAADEQYMATMSRVPSQPSHVTLTLNGGDGVPGCAYIRFIGVKFAMTGSYGSNVSAMVAVQTSGFSHTPDELPHHIGFDRCSFTYADDIEVNDAVQFDADDSFIVGSVLYNLWGAGNDGSIGVRIYNGHRILIDNNSIQSQSSAFFLGDNVPCDITDIEYTHNYQTRPSGWATGHGTQKAGGMEAKAINRLLVQDCVFENHFAVGWETLSFKVDGATNTGSTRNITVRRVLIAETYWSILVHVTGSVPNAAAGPNTDFLFEDVLAYNSTNTARFRITTADDTRQLQRVQVRNCTLLGDMRSDGDSAGDKFVLTDTIVGGTLGYFNTSTGAAGLNLAWDASYDVQYNLFLGMSAAFYDSEDDPVPAGTLANNIFTAATLGDIGFTDEPNDDYSLDTGSDYISASSTGGPLGYDSTTCDPIWAEVMGL